MIYFGGYSLLSLYVLQELVAQNIVPKRLVIWDETLSNERNILFQSSNAEIVSYAAQRAIPVLYVNSHNLFELEDQLQKVGPKILLSMCFARKIPQSIIQCCSLAFNFHPSLLPRYRGPMPVFWQLRDGNNTIGLSIHCLSQQLDCGDIMAQSELALADGMRGTEIDKAIASRVANLLRQAEHQPLNRSQDESVASYLGFPQESDFYLLPQWSARRMYNFLRGNDHLGQYFYMNMAGSRITIKGVLAFDAEQTLSDPFVQEGDNIKIKSASGTLYVCGEID